MTKHRLLPDVAAFAYWASLPPRERHARKVAEKFGVSLSTVKVAMRLGGWGAKLKEIEAKAMVATEASLQESIEVMNARHIATGQQLQRAALEAMVNLPMVSFPEALKALTAGIEMERKARGVADHKTEASLEVTLKERFRELFEVPGQPGKFKILDESGTEVDSTVEELHESA